MISIEKIPLRTLFWVLSQWFSGRSLFSCPPKRRSKSGTMANLNVDEYYSASPTPEEDCTQEDVITVAISRDDLALLKQVKHSRNVAH